MNFELVLQGKIRPMTVPTVLHSPHPTPETRAWVKPPSIQVPLRHTHQSINQSINPINQQFRKFFKVCGPTSDLLAHYGPKAPTSVTCLV